MPIFRKGKKTLNNSPKDIKQDKKGYPTSVPKGKVVKKKTKIGFRHKKKDDIPEEITPQPKKNKIKKTKTSELAEESSPITPESDIDTFEEEPDLLQDDIENEGKSEAPEEKKKQWTTSKKRKTILPKEMKNKPVFLEDTGEKLGTVFDMIYDGEKRLIGYKIKDKKSGSVLSFPIDQFDEGKDGLIFVQSWYINAVKILEKLEFKEKVSPELTTLLNDNTISNDELYNIFVKHDDQMVNYIDEAVSLKELLNQRLKVLEKQRLALKDSLMDLTEKRLIKDIDRREFSEDVATHRRKVNILDVNINKCKDLLKRLEDTSFGKLGKQIISKTEVEDKDHFIRTPKKTREELEFVLAEEIENPYKQKYDDMKECFEQLQEDYNELKSAVEKLISKGEL